jgi:hypothetical protein
MYSVRAESVKHVTFIIIKALAVVMLLPILITNEMHANSIHVKNSYTKFVENSPILGTHPPPDITTPHSARTPKIPSGDRK